VCKLYQSVLTGNRLDPLNEFEMFQAGYLSGAREIKKRAVRAIEKLKPIHGQKLTAAEQVFRDNALSALHSILEIP